jgi:Tol biopolymer transport system component
MSSATNLDPANSNSNSQWNRVYVYDRNQHILKHISQTTDPTQQWNFVDINPSISADGRFVAFTSSPGDAAGGDTFVYDLTTDSVQRAAGTSENPRISADGRYVAFTLNDGPLGHLVLYDRSMNTIERISVASDGTPGDNHDLTGGFSMGPDARYFAFASYSSNLDPTQTNTNIGIFVRDRALGVTTAVAVSQGYGGASISGDGRYVVYSNLIYDRTTNTATQFSGNTVSAASISGDGRYLVSSENNQIYLYDTVAHTPAQLLSVGTDGAIGNGGSGGVGDPIITPDGSHIGFDSWSSNLVLNDTNSVSDVFILDRISAPTVTAITPTSGAAGTSVQITGTNFIGATVVKFGTVTAMPFTVNGATSITATSPAGSGVVDVTVTVAGVTSTTGAADQFTYTAPAPVITSVSPTQVSGTTQDTMFTIYEQNFLAGAKVTLTNLSTNASQDRQPVYFSTTQLAILFPFGCTASNWSVQVVNPDMQISKPPLQFSVVTTNTTLSLLPTSRQHAASAGRSWWRTAREDYQSQADRR